MRSRQHAYQKHKSNSTGALNSLYSINLTNGDVTYEHAMLLNILNNSAPYAKEVPEEALILGNFLSSMTPTLKKLGYNHGVSIGRALYDIFGIRNRLAYPQILDQLSKFFEQVGYKNCDYNVNGRFVSFRIYKTKHKCSSGPIHDIEAGIISGFISASIGDISHISETSCAYAGGEYCSFDSAISPKFSAPESIERYALHMQREGTLEIGDKIRTEYYMLNLMPLMDLEYSDSVCIMLHYLGSRAIKYIMPDNKNKVKILQGIKAIYNKIGFGDVVCTQKPLKLEIILDDLRSNKAFADFSASFAKGALEGFSAKEDYTVTYEKQGDIYKITIK